MVRVKGLEPPSGCPRQDLNLLRLPVPPHPQITIYHPFLIAGTHTAVR